MMWLFQVVTCGSHPSERARLGVSLRHIGIAGHAHATVGMLVWGREWTFGATACGLRAVTS